MPSTSGIQESVDRHRRVAWTGRVRLPYAYQFDRRLKPPYRWIVLTDNCRVPIIRIACGRAVAVERTVTFFEKELTRVQAHFPAEHSPPLKEARLPPPYAYARRSLDSRIAPSSWPREALCLSPCSHAAIACAPARSSGRQSVSASVRHARPWLLMWCPVGQGRRRSDSWSARPSGRLWCVTG